MRSSAIGREGTLSQGRESGQRSATALIRKELSSSLEPWPWRTSSPAGTASGSSTPLGAVWCSDDPKNPTKLCPFCFRCFCDASASYKQEFWRHAPPPLVEELQTLSKSQDRLGDILIRMKKITTPQLLEALVEQRETGRKLGEILIDRCFVSREDVDAALRSQGSTRLTDTKAGADAGAVYWRQSSPDGVLDYLLALGARKRASDVSLEPRAEHVAVRYRIDGFSFRVDPIPKAFEGSLERALFAMFSLDPARRGRPQTGRTTARLGEDEFDLVLQTVPGPQGSSATIKLVNRRHVHQGLRDPRPRDRGPGAPRRGDPLRRRPRPRHLPRLQRGRHHRVRDHGLPRPGPEGRALDRVARPVDDGRGAAGGGGEGPPGPEGGGDAAGDGGGPARRADALRRPRLRHGAPRLAARLQPARGRGGPRPASAARGLVALRELGVPAPLLAGSLGLVLSQRLVRTICRICRAPAEPPAAQTLAAHGIDRDEARSLAFFKGKGCPTCNTIGYRGRRAVFEALPASPEVRLALEQGRSAAEIEAAAVESGMITHAGARPRPRPVRGHDLRRVRPPAALGERGEPRAEAGDRRGPLRGVPARAPGAARAGRRAGPSSR